MFTNSDGMEFFVSSVCIFCCWIAVCNNNKKTIWRIEKWKISTESEQKLCHWTTRNFINVGYFIRAFWIVLLFCRWIRLLLFFSSRVCVCVLLSARGIYCTRSKIRRSMRKESQISNIRLINTRTHTIKVTDSPYQKPANKWFLPCLPWHFP